jgi:hypothetical protein
MMMFDPTSLMGDSSPVMIDTSFISTKAFLKANGFESNFGSPEVVSKFNDFAQTEIDNGTYGGKSLELGEGGRATLLRHQLIISGKYGSNLEEITNENWDKINDVIRINYLKKYGAK